MLRICVGGWLASLVFVGAVSADKGSQESVAKAGMISGNASVFPTTIDIGPSPDALIWARDYKSFYALSAEGVIQQVSVPELVEIRRVDLGSKASHLFLTKRGLVVLSRPSRKVFLLDERTLTVTGSLGAGGALHLAAAPESDVIAVGDIANLRLIDLARNNKVLGTFNAFALGAESGAGLRRSPDAEVPLTAWRRIAMSRDGKMLFAGNDDTLHRFDIRSGRLFYREQSMPIGAGRRITISDDGRYVAAPVATGNNRAGSSHGGGREPATFVFSSQNIRQPAVTLSSGSESLAVAFDSKGKRMFTQNRKHPLLIYSYSGKLLESYSFPRPPGADTDQILSHPSGAGVVLNMRGKIFWMQFDEGKRARDLPGSASGGSSKSQSGAQASSKKGVWTPPPGLFKQVLAKAPELPPAGKAQALPGQPWDAFPAYGGIYMIIQFKEPKQLVVYNMASGAVEKTIPLKDPNSICAAGGQSLLIYSPSDRTLTRWDLGSLTESGAAKLASSGELTEMSMSLGYSGLALVGWVDGGVVGQRVVAMLDTASFRIIPFAPGDYRFVHTSANTIVQLRPNRAFTGFTAWAKKTSPSGFTYGSMRGKELRLVYEHENFGSLSPSYDGKQIVGGWGRILDLKGNVLFRAKESLFFPVYGSSAFAEVKEKVLNIRNGASRALVLSVDLPCKISTPRERIRLDLDRTVFVHAGLKRVFVLGLRKNNAHFLPLKTK